ncbi:MAG: hypothetical protein M1582_01395, partial [Actinobacteria bacterium]|nr:hypothetical protein [Actinomycetota bacterium]
VMSRIGGYYPPMGFRVSPQAMANWRGLLMSLFPGIPETAGGVLVLGLGAATVLLSLSVWRGSWSPSSPRFGQQMLVAALATVIASPHSHFHGTVLLLPPLAMVLAEHRGWLTVSMTGKAVVGVGYLLALIVFPLRDLSWLFVPYFLAIIVPVALASLHDRTVPRPDLVRTEALP